MSSRKKKLRIEMNGEVVTVIRVMKHKTGDTSGSAKLILSSGDLSHLSAYVTTLRPLMDPENKNPYLNILPGGRQLTKMNALLQSLGSKYNIKLPSATPVRKIGANKKGFRTLECIGCEAAVSLKGD